MKRITIKKALKSYDMNKGHGRIFKDEPHISELRSFLVQLNEKKEKTLSPSSLQKLAQILIGKKTRTDETASGQTFESLVSKFGGYEVLDTLNAAKQLTEDNIVFLEKHPIDASILAPLIISISKNIFLSELKKMYSALEKIKNPKELVIVFKELDLLSRTDNAYSYIDTLFILSQYNLNCDEVIPLLKGTENIIFINQVLGALVEKNPLLITLPNLVHMIKIKEPYMFFELFKNLPPDQKSLDSLFKANSTMRQSFWAKDIIINFQKAGWDLQSYLDLILGGKTNDYALRSATTKLMGLKLKPEVLTLTLKAIFTHSNESLELVDAVETLNKEKEGLNEDFLNTAFEFPKFSNKVAVALLTLQEAQSYNTTTKAYVCLKPEYAFGLAQFWIQFAKAECRSTAPREEMLKNPQCAAYVAEVIEFLQTHKLHDEKNIIAVCNAKLTSSALLPLLNLMNEAKILDQPSLDILLPRLSYIKTLYTGAKCLANAEKLNLFNFDSLVSEPINAVALAENLGGKSHPGNYTFLKNRGSQDFTTIRRNTKILCQGHRQGLFFPKMSSEQERWFENDSRKTLAEAQKEILTKIAVYSGNHELEDETEHHIAQDAYSTMFKF